MSIRFTKLIVVLVVSAVLSAEAQAAPEPINSPTRRESIPEVFDRAFFYESGTGFDAITIGSQLNFLFGWGSFPEGSFPENTITRDGERVHQLYLEQLFKQTGNSPNLRTRDLENPFDSSIRLNPGEYLP
ncbi:MAG: hypothetical protein DSM107014_15810 [Gomphosphaeria aponina SAG 52.96 = DSM 107014]|uniref:Uncharacterized protein n=1 Tax=Gomphosphaeria aponina SAG 52.96 = DSM 107014 TaxID=1521640 RepID=A0A941GT32_9CHRO|nr:hypothetical protein [Gomphosphaeria aponina SAG 52.96 = DSM 107014]